MSDSDRPSRRRFLISSAGAFSGAISGAIALPVASQAFAASEIKMKTYTYKTVGELKVQADVYRPDDRQVRDIVVWIHGGALINGSRQGVSGRVRKWALGAGHALVSIDYRLSPETQLPGVVSDLEDAFKWIRAEGPKLFNGNADKIAVAGGSAGGYLTLTSGFRVKPRPTALLSLWGYGDLVGEWYSKPSPHPRHHRKKLTKEEAFAQVSGKPISMAKQRTGDGGAFYQYCRQQGIWPTAVSGWDPLKQPEKFFPYMAVKHVTKEYPPTALVHGSDDTDVPFEQSEMMAEQFRQHGVSHEFIAVPKAEHGLAGGDAKLIDEAYAKAFKFMDEKMA